MRNPHATRTIAAVCLPLLLTLCASAAEPLELHLDKPADWHFVGGSGPWSESDGTIRPPDQRDLHSRAFYTPESFGDMTVEFQYNPSYRENGSGDAGFILRAADAGHFYFVSFPWVGQQMRAKHFWAAVGKVEGDGYIRYLKNTWVPGVISDTNRWYDVRLEAREDTIRVWVDGRFALAVSDETFEAGRVGLAGYGWYAFRNIRVTGDECDAPAWDRSVGMAQPAKEIAGTSGGSGAPSIAVLPDGDVLLLTANTLLRSTDQGRSWGPPESLPEKLRQTRMYASNTLHQRANGPLIIYTYRSPEPPFDGEPLPEVFISQSEDGGRTWTDPSAAEVAKGWPDAQAEVFPYGPLRPYGALVETEDGTLVSLLIGSEIEPGDQFTNILTWGAIHAKGYAIRSTDGGRSWSAPVDLDNPVFIGAQNQAPGALDYTEATGVAIGNTVMVLVRPIYSPLMWQCWSRDAGKTWESCVRAPFPGYAQSMLRLESGPILVAKRYPLYSVNVSRDDGKNWDVGTVIDYPVWAMGCMVEVEPDVALCIYMNADRGRPLLAQRIRVTDDRIEPAPW